MHGERPFLVKLQAPMDLGTCPAILIYDRQRTFREAFFCPEDARGVCEECIARMRATGGACGGLKMYRWAMRTGEYELRVCLDRERATEIKW